MTRIVRSKLRPEYVFVYDEYYQVLSRLNNVLTPILGPGYQLVAEELNAFFIPTDDDAKGIGPHRDFLRAADSLGAGGLPNLINVWIPLTDATSLNSCMYVLPGHLDPLYPHGGSEMDRKIAVDLQDIRALPAGAGSILCWNTSLLHWGGRSSRRAKHPRLSFAVYFQSRRIPPLHFTAIDIPSPIPFKHRIYLVERQWQRGARAPDVAVFPT
jgi:ectoine hydroxylase-related dioxygenase (phytanoyl-CoA dioxygenase family)